MYRNVMLINIGNNNITNKSAKVLGDSLGNINKLKIFDLGKYIYVGSKYNI